jgi:hypothetical protein
MRSMAALARLAPGQFAEALGLELAPKRARLVGVVPQGLVLGDSTRKVRATTTLGAMPAQAPGVVVSAVPPGAAQTTGRYMAWGGLAVAIAGQWWPSDARPVAGGVVAAAGLVQTEVDRAEITKPETPLSELTSGASLLPPESRVAIAVASLLGPAWSAVEGPCWRPIVTTSRPGPGSLSYRVEFSWAGNYGQLCLIVKDNSAHGPTWRQRHSDPERYVAALRRAVAGADEAMRPGGWLRRTGTTLADRGWDIVPGHPDHLLAAAGVSTHYYLRPPNAAGLLWRPPLGADLAHIVDSLRHVC